MAQLQLNQPRFFNTTLNISSPFEAGGPEATYYKETASQTYVVGDLLQIDANGTIAIVGTNGSSQITSPIAGIAQNAATGTTGASVYFHVIRPDDIYLMNVFHATAASAVTAQAQLGQIYAVIKNSSNSKWAVDIQNTTVETATLAIAKVQVIGFYLDWAVDNNGKLIQSALGDTYGMVKVKFVPFTIQTNGTGLVRNLQMA